jgi:hypothetical protein
MKKLWYTETSRDKWGAVFTFKDWNVDYAIRLAGNPILLLEHYYNMKWWIDFMKNYNLIKNWKSTDVSKLNMKILTESKKFCEDFIETVKLISQSNKSTFVIYKIGGE